METVWHLMTHALIWYLCVMIMGSVNTVVFRLVRNRRLGDLFSCYCDSCGARLSFVDSGLPVVNFLLRRGRSRCCNRPISLLHPLAEIVGGSAFSSSVFCGPSGFIWISVPRTCTVSTGRQIATVCVNHNAELEGESKSDRVRSDYSDVGLEERHGSWITDAYRTPAGLRTMATRSL